MEERYINLLQELKTIIPETNNMIIHPIFGFDLFYLERILNIPNDISMKDFIKNKYGENSVNIILELIKYTPKFN